MIGQFRTNSWVLHARRCIHAGDSCPYNLSSIESFRERLSRPLSYVAELHLPAAQDPKNFRPLHVHRDGTSIVRIVRLANQGEGYTRAAKSADDVRTVPAISIGEAGSDDNDRLSHDA